LEYGVGNALKEILSLGYPKYRISFYSRAYDSFTSEKGYPFIDDLISGVHLVGIGVRWRWWMISIAISEICGICIVLVPLIYKLVIIKRLKSAVLPKLINF
jgi:hypothetical protein